uniref:Uncharacterized protein n=1 Tax=Glossina brevipalpis TaxID=37001 RepID=A0A1A9WJQ8_9MUSC
MNNINNNNNSDMLARTPLIDTRPFRGEPASSSDLIAGNEFLKLFLERDELQRDLYSSEYVGGSRARGGGGGGTAASGSGTEGGGSGSGDSSDIIADSAPAESVPVVENVKRSANSRSLREKGSKGHQSLTSSHEEDGKQVVKLVTTGSKIVFLEDYDENDAILDAEVREIDLKKEKPTTKKNISSRTSNLDDFKVVAVSVSSSSQRASSSNNIRRKHERPQLTTSSSLTARTSTTTQEPPSKVDLTSGDNFINRSHKSELSIDEVEPFTSKHKARRPSLRSQISVKNKNTSNRPDTIDSENSASTNVQNVLAVPLQAAASLRSNQYHSNGQHHSNATTISNHKMNSHNVNASSSSSAHANVDDQLLPFQTVIYHDNKEGHGPQSRSISYSSISQNIQDLQKWQHTGILAEARRNVSESLKPMSPIHQAEPSKFYSQPSQMYSIPAKFYSEPAKVYSEPSKMYGEPEKFYSEPAKVYGEPAKFYSEPSKVYSQPAKVYSEPAKTYWPPTPTDSSSTTTTLATPATSSLFATPTTTPSRNGLYTSSRRPAIVSRIAFGEAQNTLTSTSTASTLTAMTTTAGSSLSSSSTAKSFGSYHQRNFGHRHFSSSSGNNGNSSPTSTPRRIPLFNLDKLPYDVLNAPKPSITQQQQEHEQVLTNNYQQKQQQQQQQHQQTRSHINPCLESAVSTLFSTSSLSAHVPIQQQQQHSSLSDQHSNQNAKGLPNGDLVKCVAEISHTTLATTEATLSSHHFTTERTHNEDLYAATPEQNYEIEESVSVMTNGRAHGVQRDGSVIGSTGGTNDDGNRGELVESYDDYSDVDEGEVGISGGDGGGSDVLKTNNRHNSYINHNRGGGGGGPGGAGGVGLNAGSQAEQNENDDAKVAYVVEGRNYRKYRVEEKTDDGFIVGEYGVVDHNDGNLRGVRYTADSTINRSLIQKALLTFLKLK